MVQASKSAENLRALMKDPKGRTAYKQVCTFMRMKSEANIRSANKKVRPAVAMLFSNRPEQQRKKHPDEVKQTPQFSSEIDDERVCSQMSIARVVPQADKLESAQQRNKAEKQSKKMLGRYSSALDMSSSKGSLTKQIQPSGLVQYQQNEEESKDLRPINVSKSDLDEPVVAREQRDG